MFLQNTVQQLVQILRTGSDGLPQSPEAGSPVSLSVQAAMMDPVVTWVLRIAPKSLVWRLRNNKQSSGQRFRPLVQEALYTARSTVAETVQNHDNGIWLTCAPKRQDTTDLPRFSPSCRVTFIVAGVDFCSPLDDRNTKTMAMGLDTGSLCHNGIEQQTKNKTGRT